MSLAPPTNYLIETGIYCDDLDAARRFYTDVMGLRLVSEDRGRDLFYAVGQTMLLVFAPGETLKGGALPPHGTSGPGHFALQIEAGDYERWLEHLRGHGIAIEHEQDWSKDNARSIYFRDPSGNLVELVTRPMWERHFESVYTA